MRTWRVGSVLVSLGLVVATVAGCHKTSHRATTPTTATGGATTSGSALTPTSEDRVPECVDNKPENSASTYDPQRGLYATYLKSFDLGSRQLTFDVIQWLSGDAANRAYARDFGDTSGAPNDYYIVNASPKTYVATASPHAGVRILTGVVYPMRRGSLADLAVHLSNERTENGDTNPTYWITIDRGVVTDICEQYRP